MRIGIIAEGRTDQAVIKNILRGIGFDSSIAFDIRPSLQQDETDLNNNQTIGTWQGVKNTCIQKDDFERVFSIADNKFVIIQMDTAECEHADFGIKRPKKDNNLQYSSELRAILIEKIREWLEGTYTDKLLYAISIEEMESWILAGFATSNTVNSIDPKSKLFSSNGELRRRNITKKECRDDADFYKKITSDFTKKKNLLNYAKLNQSLNDFIESLYPVFQLYINED
jgi:hypothetical protein